MATTGNKTGTSRKKATAKVEQQQAKEPTREDIWAATRWVCENTNLVPTLWGQTAVGKTYGADKFAESLNAELVTILLQQHTPDEIAGFQVNVGDKLVAQEPYWWQHAQQVLDTGKSVVLLFDELGLARDEVRGALYTFFRDRHLHNKHLKPKGNARVYVIAATNPAPLAAPFLTRTILFHVPADRSYMMGIAKRSSLAARVAEIAPLSIENGDSAFQLTQPPMPQVVTAATIDALNQLDSDFWNMTEEAQRLIFGGLVPGSVLEEVFRDKQDVSTLLRDPDTLEVQLQELDAPDAITLALSALEALDTVTPKEGSHAMVAILVGLWSDVYFKLKPYYEAEKSERARNGVLQIDAHEMLEVLSKRGLLVEKSGGIAGKLVEDFLEQQKKHDG